MGKQDNVTKAFFSDPYVFADIFNYWLHGGMQIIEPDQLKEASESMVSFSSQRKKHLHPTEEMAEREAVGRNSQSTQSSHKAEKRKMDIAEIYERGSLDSGNYIGHIFGVTGVGWTAYIA